MNSLNKKLHITLITAAGLGVLLIYTTMLVVLIGMATGLAFGLSIRLYFAHQKNGFLKTKKLDWIVMIVVSSMALIFMLAQAYDIQAITLIFVTVRSLLMYFSIYSGNSPIEVIDIKKS